MAFVYLSDDRKWGRQNLENDLGDLFFPTWRSANPDDPGSVAFDLALLAGCNHTIITHGSFSVWAGILAGGMTYTQDGVLEGNLITG